MASCLLSCQRQWLTPAPLSLLAAFWDPGPGVAGPQSLGHDGGLQTGQEQGRTQHCAERGPAGALAVPGAVPWTCLGHGSPQAKLCLQSCGTCAASVLLVLLIYLFFF